MNTGDWPLLLQELGDDANSFMFYCRRLAIPGVVEAEDLFIESLVRAAPHAMRIDNHLAYLKAVARRVRTQFTKNTLDTIDDFPDIEVADATLDIDELEEARQRIPEIIKHLKGRKYFQTACWTLKKLYKLRYSTIATAFESVSLPGTTAVNVHEQLLKLAHISHPEHVGERILRELEPREDEVRKLADDLKMNTPGYWHHEKCPYGRSRLEIPDIGKSAFGISRAV